MVHFSNFNGNESRDEVGELNLHEISEHIPMEENLIAQQETLMRKNVKHKSFIAYYLMSMLRNFLSLQFILVNLEISWNES